MIRASDPSGPDAPLGLHQVADRLGVHYMTVYRYVRTGRLPATVVGGRWQVDPADLDALVAGPGGPPVGRRPGGSRSRVAGRLEARLVAGDETGAVAVCEEALGSWAVPIDLHLALLVPALRSIGRRWETGELTVADEHRASAVATRVMGRFGPRFVPRGRTRGTVVIGATAGERHALPVMVVGDLLRHAGFAVVDLGADTPAASMVDAARSADRLLAVAVGATVPGAEPSLRAVVAAVHQGVPGVPVLVGGAGVTPGAAEQMEADGWSGSDGRTLVELVEELATSRGRTPGVDPPAR
jgi:MerR family transcriptional regulator, light-induced transcriptional regulator